MEPHVTVNGTAHALGEVGGHVTLLDWLRGTGFTGSKEGCAEGECGACAVLVARPDGDGSVPGGPRSTPAWCRPPGLDNQEVITAEGLGDPDALHPVQREMADRGGSQCGYCTPGFICSMASEYYRPDRPAPADRQRQRSVAGAERRPRHRAVRAAERRTRCRPAGRPDGAGTRARPRARPERLRPARAVRKPVPLHRLPADPGRRLRARRPGRGRPAVRPARTAGAGPGRHPDHQRAGGTLSSGRPTWPRRWTCSPRTRRHGCVAGSTDWGVELNIRHARAALTIGIDRLAELRQLVVGDDRIDIGAALTLSEIERGPGRPGAAAGRDVPAVRVPADPQRRHPGRQPGHRLADRRQPAGAAGAGRLAGARLARR